MKKSAFLLVFMFVLLKTNAQDYLISFSGAGDFTVKVDNLASGATVTLNGNDVLNLTSPWGIGGQDMTNRKAQVNPNPMTNQSTLTFTAPEGGNAVIGIVDLSGQTVCQTGELLSAGRYNFQISGLRQGLYFVKISGKNYFYSAKLISRNQQQGNPGIVYISGDRSNTGPGLKSPSATIEMPYSDGDQLLFKGISGTTGTVVPDVPASSKTIMFTFIECTDADGNNYSIIQKGKQTWMAENLRVGVRINGNQDQLNNGVIEKYCYDDNPENCNIYGGLYQWQEMMQYTVAPGKQGICPMNWHLPTNGEWSALASNFGGPDLAGGKLKSTGTLEDGTGLWHTPNAGATNEGGFTAIPGGYRSYDGLFTNLGNNGWWWSSSVSYFWGPWERGMDYLIGSIHSGYYYNEISGFSVRCIWDW